MVLLVGLGKFVERIWKNKMYRWSSCIICTVVFFLLYDYLYRIIAHTIIHIPIWIWGIIPVITILALLLAVGIKEKSVILSVVSGGCFGIVVTGILSILFYTTNYWFASSRTYRLDAYVIGKGYHKKGVGRRNLFNLSVYDVNLEFSNNKDLFVLDDPGAYKKTNQGDTVSVSLVKGLYGIPIIKEMSPKCK